MDNHTLLLDQEDVIRAGGLDMEAAVADMEEVFRLKMAGDFVLPSKVVLRWGDMESEITRGRFNAMPAFIGGRFNAVGIKWISSVPKNVERGLPRAIGTIVLNDPQTGMPLAIMDGTLISAMRTGAVTGLAARYLAREDASIVGLIGAGVQSRTQLRAILVARPCVSKVRVYDLDATRAARFAREMGKEVGREIEVVKSPQECAAGSDILVTATTANDPIVFEEWLPRGCFYVSIHGREAADDVVERVEKVVVDNWEEVLHRGNNTLALMHAAGRISRDDLYAELGDIITGARDGRSDNEERIFLSTVGMGIEDVAVAARVFQRAQEMGLGQSLDYWKTPFPA